jgi:hypothetical protein
MGTFLEHDRPRSEGARIRISIPLTAFMIAAAVLLGTLGAAQESQASKALAIYKSKLDTEDKRAEITKFNRGDRCAKLSKPTAIRVSVGNETKECFMRIPVVGKNVEVSAIGRLFKSTPKSIRGRTYIALSVRQSGNGSRYQLAVFPAAKKFQLRKVLPNGTIEYFGAGKASSIKGVGEANRMSLRVFNGVGGSPPSTARLVASVNGKRVAFGNDPAGSSLTGTAATFSVGSTRVATGALGSFTSLIAKIPDPFA